jgi:hypothetical protein
MSRIGDARRERDDDLIGPAQSNQVKHRSYRAQAIQHPAKKAPWL